MTREKSNFLNQNYFFNTVSNMSSMIVIVNYNDKYTAGYKTIILHLQNKL